MIERKDLNRKEVCYMIGNLEANAIKITSKNSSGLALRVLPGHFATNHSHINYYIDITPIKTHHDQAVSAGKCFASKYAGSAPIDTIVCMDGMEVIGAFLADALAQGGIHSMNSKASICVISPEYNSNGQMIFRDNLQPMITGKNIILLLASATTGKTIRRFLECINYYRGKVQGISCIFSAVNSVNGINIDPIFHADDVPDYSTYNYTECPFCKNNQKLDALVNSYGYSKL